MPREESTFTVRDGYHLQALNAENGSRVDKSFFPELLREQVVPQSVKAPAERLAEPTTTDAAPLEAWLVFRHRDLVQRGNQEPTPPPPTSSPRHYEQPLQRFRPRKYTPATQLRLLPRLQRPRLLGTPPLLPVAGVEEVKLYETENSKWRRRTTVKVSRISTLSARIAQFMLAPQALEGIEEAARERKRLQQAALDVNLVAKNKHLVVRPPPPDHQLVRAETLQLRKEAQLRRYVEHQETIRYATEASVDRWGARRRQDLALQLRHDRTKRILVCVYVALGAVRLRQRLAMVEATIKMGHMINATRKIQAFWRTKTLAFSLAHAAAAVHTIQSFILRRIGHYREHMKRRAIHIIITSCAECQDAKFRRAMLKYRHFITKFQAMWRSWAAITEARVKLLLLFWNKIDKRHHGAGIGSKLKF
ncbi:hypothetical protein ACHHYP_10614 [Achlya hypogyna]|uniref:Uncharacterized protein n=1 Tax=Achlya hypogyna TaxID=1202772 RepID=A0A1V9YL06_ACHHY|nr:hypothetical protein ACHHYP_10614 [Achlya hypogyna]